MDFYPNAYRILKKENTRLLRELNTARAELRKLRAQVTQLQLKLGKGNQLIIREEVSAKAGKAEVESRRGLSHSFAEIVGESEKLLEMLRYLEHVIESNVPVLIQGESGTGKELVARAIHFKGPRRLKKFIAENCAAIPEQLLESELFGYEPGAFTGAIGLKKGLFELADGGTLFLDEISNMSSSMQKKLLRVLQDGMIRRVGGGELIKLDVRIITASNKNLPDLVKKKRFRDDLFYRINVVTIELPPLRERRDDIQLLTEYFFEKITLETGSVRGKLQPEVLETFSKYDWPGNVRELENEIYRLVALSDDGNITPDLVSAHIRYALEPEPVKHPFPKIERLDENTLRKAVANVERKIMARALERTGGNRTKAAKMLGLSTAGFIKKMDRCGLSIVMNIKEKKEKEHSKKGKE